MTEGELLRLFEEHEALVARCVAGELSLEEFLERYDNFPFVYALDGHESPLDPRLAERYRTRVQFHVGVMDTLSNLCTAEDAAKPEYRRAGRFGPQEGVQRLREFVENRGQ